MDPGPLVSALGSTDPKYKSPAAYFNFRKYQNLAKIIFNYLFIRKKVYNI
jgi:hypothetical protein